MLCIFSYILAFTNTLAFIIINDLLNLLTIGRFTEMSSPLVADLIQALRNSENP